MNKNFEEWMDGKDINKNIEEILRKIDAALSPFSNHTRRGKTRISFGEEKGLKRRYIIAFWEANAVKLQVQSEFYPNYEDFLFGEPKHQDHSDKGYMELIINDISQFTDDVKKFLIKELQ